MLATLPHLQPTTFPSLHRKSVETLQVNLGYVCNQQCLHCHVNAGPQRTEVMDWNTCQQVLDGAERIDVQQLDLTGGAPEMNPHFRKLVTEAYARGLHLLDRCNLTVLTLPEQADLAAFLAAHQVDIIASLPCYLQNNVDAQRGNGVFERSMQALQKLNALGYGKTDAKLQLSLVFNPQGADLPPPQDALEASYKKILFENYGVVFNQLFTLCNMPIQRFGSQLLSKGQFNAYLNLLRTAHRMENLDSVMCRHLLSVDWQGMVYDCDFNQMLRLPLQHPQRQCTHISELTAHDLYNNPIVVAEHCYGCTAGQGSSCGGALS